MCSMQAVHCHSMHQEMSMFSSQAAIHANVKLLLPVNTHLESGQSYCKQELVSYCHRKSVLSVWGTCITNKLRLSFALEGMIFWALWLVSVY